MKRCYWGLSLLLVGCNVADPRTGSDVRGTQIQSSNDVNLTGVAANPRATGVPSPNNLSPELIATVAAAGSQPVENPSVLPLGDSVTHYGYDSDGPLVPAPGDLPSATHKVEATKTEPDKITYLVLDGQTGPDPAYDYGTHFLFQGHENGARGNGTITRINLDADPAHRVTVMAVADRDGLPLPAIDGSTWDPYAQKLLFTAELGNKGGVVQMGTDFPGVAEDISGALGRGGYEGIQNDSDGNLWIAEDVGGGSGVVNNKARQPNSFLYRFVPVDKTDLHHGKLQALQVVASTGPITFHAADRDGDILSVGMAELHTYGNAMPTHWVTLHDTEVDGTAPFDANALAKARGATPLKRPENGAFRPGSHFTEFLLPETGDTNILSQAGSAFGGFGAVLSIRQAAPSDNDGTVSMIYRCDPAHSGFDNIAFWDDNHVAIVEDAGDTLHGQRNALDSGYLFDLRTDFSGGAQPTRFLGEGRDPAATLDAQFSGMAGFQNDGDNEITGIHVSDGDAGEHGILGEKIPRPFLGYRVFFVQQHGENIAWELLPRP
jgi:hypothetical protein